MGLWKWTEGRQGTGYVVWTIWSSKLLKCDCHRIKYFQGAFIPPHTDPSPIPGHIHHRLNIEWLSKDCVGGKLLVENRLATPIFSYGRLKIYHFLSSEQVHQVTEVTQGRRKVLSVGWLAKVTTKN